MKFRSASLFLLAAGLLAAAGTPAHAITVTGGVDPVSGLTTLLPYALKLAGIVICLICAVHGVMAVGEGRRFVPYLGAAVGGLALSFGASYLLTAYGIV